ncbi:MAG: metalloregulator ArsR/SmtB family transcription factor [Actinomycetota bacterium]|nr:metalloregulator ArsR/SmtB family transcription factor [Actinomycetota bacterium]
MTPPPGAARPADDIFAAVADPTRRRLLDQLSTEGPRTATELAADYPVSRQALVKHLAVLTTAGLLRPDRHGREVRYLVVPDRLAEATAWMVEVGDRWDRRLALLQRRLAPPAGHGKPEPPRT